MKARTQTNPAGPVLTASAIVVAALIIVQAGRLPGNPAHAEMATTYGDFTVMTSNSGQGGNEDPWELLYVLDSREQVLLVYEVTDARQNQMVLREGGSIENLFRAARR